MTTQEIQDKIQAHQKAKTKIVKPTVSVKEIIQKLEKLGYRTKITHYRYFGTRLLKNADVHVLMKALKIMGNDITKACKKEGDFIRSKGGMTEVEVRTRAQNYFSTYHATAECSKQDNFVYSKAGRLALYRVLGQLPDEDVQKYRKELEKMYLKYQIQIKENGRWMDYIENKEQLFLLEDKEIAKNEAEEIAHETNKETRVITVFE